MLSALETLNLLLFVPADRPERFGKAINAGADAIIIDLEDAVSPDSKASARKGLEAALSSLELSVPVLLRINALGTSWHKDDLTAASHLPIAGIVLPKAEQGADVDAVNNQTRLPVVSLIESAKGLANVRSIANHSARLAFGSIDYAADLAMGHTRPSLLTARAEIVLASRLANRPPPIDGVTTAIQDSAVIADDCAHSVEMGFGGKLLIHPAQISPSRQGFRPLPEEIDWANRVLQAAESGERAIRVDGAMVDAPVIMRARQIMQKAPKPADKEGKLS